MDNFELGEQEIFMQKRKQEDDSKIWDNEFSQDILAPEETETKSSKIGVHNIHHMNSEN